MKKKLFTSIFLIICYKSHSQFVGNEQQINSKELNKAESIWHTRSYFALNVIKPMGIYGDNPKNSTTNFDDIYTQKTGFGAQNGYGFEVGQLYFLNNLVFPNNTTLPDNMRFGINANFINFSFVKYNWNKINYLTFDPANVATLSMKLGGLFSFNIFEQFFIDACVNIVPSMVLIQENYAFYDNGLYDKYKYTSTFGSDLNIGRGIKYDFGVNLRYSKLSFGCFWNIGKTNHTFNYYTYSNIGNDYISNDYTTVSKFKSSSFNIKITSL